MFSDILHSASSGNAWLPIADAVAKATILLAVAALFSVVLRRKSAAARHLVWTLALISALVLPVLSIVLPRWPLPLVTLASAGDTVSTAVSDVTAPAAPAFRSDLTRVSGAPAAVVSPAEAGHSDSVTPRNGATPAAGWPTRLSWPAVLLLIWATGAVLILGRLLIGMLAVQWMSRRTERVIDAPWLPLARELAAELGITPRILFLRSGRAAMPMAWGVVLPSVLMPADADTWPAERLRIVLLHELAHVKRRDCLTHMLAQISCALYWFNPLAWMAARHVRTERERACDDLVLAAGTRGSEYANQLLEIARVMRAGRFPGVLAGASLAMARRSQLEGRLMAILDPTVPRAGVTRLRTARAATLFAVALMPLASMQPWTYAAAPGANAVAGEPAVQNPMPTPTPTPNPTPTPTLGELGSIAGAIQGVAPDMVRGVVEGTKEGMIEGAIQGSLQGLLQGTIQGTTQSVVQSIVGPRVNVENRENVVQGGHKAADPKVLAALTAALKDSDKDVRETAMQALVQMRDPGIYEPLIQALSDESADVREKAAFGLGQMHDKRAVAPLTQAMKDTDADVRQQAAFSLGQLRDRSAVPALVEALRDEAPDVREQAVFALGQLRDPAAIDGLTAALRDPKPDVRQQAAFALGQLRDKRSVEPLISALKDADADVRQQAAFGLGQIRDRGAVEALVIALKDSAPDVRQQAAFALGQLGDARAIDGLTNALKDPVADVRQQAAFALGQIAR